MLRRRDGLLDIESVHPFSNPEEIQVGTGFPVTVSADTPVTPAPTAEELAALRAIDPTGVVGAELHGR